MSQKSGTPKMSSERIVKDIRRATRKQYSTEEGIRIVLDGKNLAKWTNRRSRRVWKS